MAEPVDQFPSSSDLVTAAVAVRLAVQTRDRRAARRRLKALVDTAIAVEREIEQLPSRVSR
jgi:hypothetical protein